MKCIKNKPSNLVTYNLQMRLIFGIVTALKYKNINKYIGELDFIILKNENLNRFNFIFV